MTRTQQLMQNSRTFAFGRNWKRFLDRHIDAEAIEYASQCLSDLLESADLRGLSFLDVGCGSGLSSLAAHRLGADRIVSFDVDQQSVECCRYLRASENAPDNWDVLQGSILDRGFVEKLGTFDVVLSWGVLHHTGAMWQALENASQLVSEEGALAIALYNRAEALGLYPDGRFGPSRLWVGLKRLYGLLPAALQNLVDYGALVTFWAACLVTFRNPWRATREYRKLRGMALRTDIKDWLGGYPYEYASVEQVFRFMKERGYTLTNLRYHGGLRCNEYVFRRPPLTTLDQGPSWRK